MGMTRLDKRPERIPAEHCNGEWGQWEFFSLTRDGEAYAVVGLAVSMGQGGFIFKPLREVSPGYVKHFLREDLGLVKARARERGAARLVSFAGPDDRQFVKFTRLAGFSDHVQAATLNLEDAHVRR